MANVPLGIETSVSGVSAVVGDLKKIEAQSAAITRSTAGQATEFQKTARAIKGGVEPVRGAFSALGLASSSLGGQIGGLANQIIGSFGAGGPVVGAISAFSAVAVAGLQAVNKSLDEERTMLNGMVADTKKAQQALIDAGLITPKLTPNEEAKRFAGQIRGQENPNIVAVENALRNAEQLTEIAARVNATSRTDQSRLQLGQNKEAENILRELLSEIVADAEKKNAQRLEAEKKQTEYLRKIAEKSGDASREIVFL